MNERIRELIEQATTVEEHKWGVSYDNFNKEKFAQLIELDTIKYCRDMFVVGSVSWNLLNETLEHFGVE
jgi:hypothetical protein